MARDMPVICLGGRDKRISSSGSSLAIHTEIQGQPGLYETLFQKTQRKVGWLTVACHTLATTSVAGDRCGGRCLALSWVSGAVKEGVYQTWLWFWLHSQFPRESLPLTRPQVSSMPWELRLSPLSLRGQAFHCWATGPLSGLASGLRTRASSSY